MRERWLAHSGFLLLLVVFVELIAWYRAGTYSVVDWLVVVVLDVTLAAMVVDFMLRWYTGTGLTLVIAGGIFGVLHGIIVTPGIQSNLPLSLVIFGTSMPALMFILAYATYQLLFVGQMPFSRWWLLVPFVGVLHGLWAKWIPTLRNIEVAVPDIGEFLPYSVIGLVVAGLYVYAVRLPTHIEQHHWLMTPVEWVPVILPTIAVLAIRAESGDIETFPLALSSVIVGVLIGLMWFFHGLTRRPVLSVKFAPNRQFVMQWMSAIVVFTVAAWLGYSLPGDGNQSAPALLLFATLVLYGVSWPPLVSVFISFQAFIDLSRQEY